MFTGVGAERAGAGDTAEAGAGEHVHTVYVEYSNPTPTPVPPACDAATPPKCVLALINRTGVLGGDLAGSFVGVSSVTGRPAAPGQSTIQSWAGSTVYTVTSGPCGSGSFVTQSMMTNPTETVLPDGRTVLGGEIRAQIVPGGGTGGYEGVTGKAFGFGSKPAVGSAPAVLFNSLKLKCRR